MLCVQYEDRLHDWSQTPGGEGGAAHPGLHHAHQYLHSGIKKILPNPISTPTYLNLRVC